MAAVHQGPPATGAQWKKKKKIYMYIPKITETIRLHRLHWFGHVQRMEENIFQKDYWI
jgi:hypothetical protein